MWHGATERYASGVGRWERSEGGGVGGEVVEEAGEADGTVEGVDGSGD